MDIAGYVDYELLYQLDLKNPSTDEPLGITFMIRSAGSDAAKAVLRKHTTKNIERRIKNKTPTPEMMELEELEKAASYIASWNWGEHTYKGAVPELSMKKAVEILNDQGWIFGQVVEAALKIDNFSPPSR